MISSAKFLKTSKATQDQLGFNIVLRLGKVIRLSSLSFLFAGSATIVFAAIVMVKAGEAHGLSVTEAAAANAPMFIQFSKIVAGAAVALMIAEGMDCLLTRNLTKLKLVQYGASIFCCLCGFTYAFVSAPIMEQLLPFITSDPQAHASFQHFHQTSRLLFCGMIFFSWLALILPAFAGLVSGNQDQGQTD